MCLRNSAFEVNKSHKSYRPCMVCRYDSVDAKYVPRRKIHVHLTVWCLAQSKKKICVNHSSLLSLRPSSRRMVLWVLTGWEKSDSKACIWMNRWRILDLTCGISVANLGWSHTWINCAMPVHRHLSTTLAASNWLYIFLYLGHANPRVSKAAAHHTMMLVYSLVSLTFFSFTVFHVVFSR